MSKFVHCFKTQYNQSELVDEKEIVDYFAKLDVPSVGTFPMTP